MTALKILHASDAFFKPEDDERLKTFQEYLLETDADVIIFTGNMGFDKMPDTPAPTIYVEGDFEHVDYAYTEPKIIYIGEFTSLVVPHTPNKDVDTFLEQLQGEEIDIIISPAGPIDTHFLKGNKTYDVLFDLAYFRSPKLWFSGYYNFMPFYQTIVPVRNPRKKYCNIFGVNTSYGYIEEITIDDKLDVKEYHLKKIFNGHGRNIF